MLRVEGLNAYYGRLQVLFNINLEVGKGEIVAVLGPNGAGKTTLLKSIINVDVVKTGKVKLEATDITSLPTYKIAELGVHYVPDYGGLLPGITVLDNLRLASNTRNPDLSELEEFYPELRNLLWRKADVLSGGERKIISIIRSLLANTKLLLLDEPTEGMSPIMVDKTCKLLKELNAKKGLTILWVEPGAKLRKVLEVADKMAIMTAGRITYFETAERARREIDVIKERLFI
ncbi:MAG: ATP-binding cassette domain-containing protein [Acidilobaceae archaeon]